jgi:hypothetical protein
VESYRDLYEVFDGNRPKLNGQYVSYQLIRDVLAAHYLGLSFCVLLDARRPDLIEAWFAVMKCVKLADLRTRCKILTWQELAETLPEQVQEFLDHKYGIVPPGRTSSPWGESECDPKQNAPTQPSPEALSRTALPRSLLNHNLS